MRSFVRRAFAAIVLASALSLAAFAQGKLTTPRQFFGHEVGEDYWLPNYAQFSKYWETLAKESDRMVLDTIGLTAEGRPQLLAIVSSPDNLKNREKYRQIAERLSHAEGLTEAQAKALAKEGKAIIWIDGGLHATEVLGVNQLIETLWQFVSMNDEETMRILNDVIIVFVHANPDGMELVANWYMQEQDPKKRNMNIPDVSLHANYLACSSETRSELVILIRSGDVIHAQIDIDSHELAAFDDDAVVKVQRVADWLALAYAARGTPSDRI